MRTFSGAVMGGIAVIVSGCSGDESSNTVTGDRTTQVQIHNELAPAGEGPDLMDNGQVNMTDPTAGEEVEPALNNSVSMDPSDR